MPGIRCAWCNQFVSPDDVVTFQPETPVYKLEPEDPELLCMKCAVAGLKSARDK